MSHLDSDPNEPTRPIDAAAAALLVANHRAFLAFLDRRVGDPVLAEEILQDAFVRSLPKLEALRERESAVAWFYRVLRNAVIDHGRRRGAAHRALDAFAAELRGAEEPPQDVHDAVCQCVARLADTLKPEYAEALRRIEVEGAAVKDYAAEIGVPDNTAAVRVYRARNALRTQVARSCGTCAEHGCLDCSCGAH